jgi:hypothetical protein
VHIPLSVQESWIGNILRTKIPVMSFVASSAFVGFFFAPFTPTPNPTLYTGRGITVEDTGTSTEM